LTGGHKQSQAVAKSLSRHTIFYNSKRPFQDARSISVILQNGVVDDAEGMNIWGTSGTLGKSVLYTKETN
jgi:hypothetical protein